MLIRRLKGRPPVSDLFGVKGRAWLAELELPIDERETVDAGLRQIDFLDAEIARVDRADRARGAQLARRAAADDRPGVNLIVAATFLAAVGDIRRFPDSRASSSATSASIPRSASPATRPPRTAGSPSRARPRSATRSSRPAGAPSAHPGPLRAFYQRVRARRGHQIAIVATARKLACLFWCLLTRQQDYAYGQPSLTRKKLRRLEITAGAPALAGRPRRLDRQPTDAPRRRTRPRPAGRARLPTHRPRLAGHGSAESGRERDTGARIT